MSSVGIVHDGHGQLKPLTGKDLEVYEAVRRLGHGLMHLNSGFQDNLARGRSNDWRCGAGARYLYVDESGLVHYCSQQRGAPAIPLEQHTREHIRREFLTPKGYAAFCTVNRVQQVGMFDNWRAPQTAPETLSAGQAGDQAAAG